MATKGTYAAWQKSTAPAVDFGKAAEDIAGAVEGKRASMLAEELAKNKLEIAEKAATQKSQKEIAAQTKQLQDLGKEMPNMDTSGMLNPVLTKMASSMSEQYANLMRMYTNADSATQNEILIQAARYKNIGKNFDVMTKDFNAFMQDYASKVGKPGGYSGISSAGNALGIIEAIKGAATGELTENEDGSFSWGDRIKITNMGTPDMKFELFDANGKSLTERPQSVNSLVASLRGNMKPYQDIDGIPALMDKIEPSYTQAYKEKGTAVELGKAINKKNTMDSFRQAARDIISNPDMLNDLKASGRYGDTEKEIIENIAADAWKRVAKNYSENLYNNPNYSQGDKTKQEYLDFAVNRYIGVLKGDPNEIGKIGKWQDSSYTPFESGTVNDMYKVKGTNTYAVRLKAGNKRSDYIMYDMNNPEQNMRFRNTLSKAVSEKLGNFPVEVFEQRIKGMDLSTVPSGKEMTADYANLYNEINQSTKGLQDLADNMKENKIDRVWDSDIEKAMKPLIEKIKELKGVNIVVNSTSGPGRVFNSTNDITVENDKEGKLQSLNINIKSGEVDNEYINSIIDGLGEVTNVISEADTPKTTPKPTPTPTPTKKTLTPEEIAAQIAG